MEHQEQLASPDIDALSHELKTIFSGHFLVPAHEVVSPPASDSWTKFRDHLATYDLCYHHSKDYPTVIDNVFSVFDLCKDVDSLEQECQQFLYALLLLGSPKSNKLSRKLREEWNSKAKDVLGVASFVKEETSIKDEQKILSKWNVQQLQQQFPNNHHQKQSWRTMRLQDNFDAENIPFKVLNMFYSRIVDVIYKHDITFPFADKLCEVGLITLATRGQINTMTSGIVQAKTVVGQIRTIVMRAVLPQKQLLKFISVISTRKFRRYFRHILDGMDGKGFRVTPQFINQIETWQYDSIEKTVTSNEFLPLKKLDCHKLPNNQYIRHLYLRYLNIKPEFLSATSVLEWKFFELATSEESVAIPTETNKSGGALNLRSIPQKLEYPPRTLIVGGPGMGKSSIVIELCKRWYNRDLLQEYEYVILLEGHNPQVNNAKDLDDLVLNPEWMIPIRKADGKNSLFIIDGYEDLSEECRQQNSFINQFISGQILQEASFIVTTRPWCAKAISKYFSNETTVEILGFTQQGRKEFIKYKLKGDDDEFIYLQKPMERCSTIPFCLATLIEIYDEKRKNPRASKVSLTFPNLSMVYGELIRTLVLRFVRKNQEYFKFMPDSIEIPPGEFIKFPGPIYRSFLELCAFSYTSMMQPSEHNASLEIETFNLFKQHATESTSGNKTYYTCLHSSIQEYLAAYCISRMNEGDRKLRIASMERSNRYHLMLEFLAGFTKCFTLIDHDCTKLFQNVHDFHIFRQLCEANSDKLIQDAFLNHVNPCVVKRSWPIPSPTDFWCLGKIIALSSHDWELGFTLRRLQNSHLKMLCEGINSIDMPSGRIVKFSLSLNIFDENGLHHMFQINENCIHTTKEFFLIGNQLTSITIPMLCDSFPKTFINLRKFLFHHNNIQPGHHKPLIMEGLARCNYLEHVSLSSLIPDECHLLLTKIKRLKIVELWQISPQSCKVVFDTLSQTSILQLEIHESELNDDCFKNLQRKLPRSQVTTLKLINCGIDSNMVQVIVEASKKLLSIDLSDNVICDEGGKSLLRLHRKFGVNLLETEKCNNFSYDMIKEFEDEHGDNRCQVKTRGKAAQQRFYSIPGSYLKTKKQLY